MQAHGDNGSQMQPNAGTRHELDLEAVVDVPGAQLLTSSKLKCHLSKHPQAFYEVPCAL